MWMIAVVGVQDCVDVVAYKYVPEHWPPLMDVTGSYHRPEPKLQQDLADLLVSEERIEGFEATSVLYELGCLMQ